jgi:cobyrinic acid a,c-diamide synthase
MIADASCTGFVVAGTGSGVGKTSISIGLAVALRRRGIRVHPFKVGPDFLDPTYLSAASGSTCYNLDTWMCGQDYVKSLYRSQTNMGGLALVEGVMGLFDGAKTDSSVGSSAEVARLLNLPVLLVVNAHGVARSICATVKGFASFEDGVKIAGVIANHVGSEAHTQMLKEALHASDLPPLIGAIPRGSLPELNSRHLGLVSASEEQALSTTLDELADAIETYLDVDAFAGSALTPIDSNTTTVPLAKEQNVRIGLAWDEAFCFAYPDNLEALETAGAQLVRFSPCIDPVLPSNLDAVYFPGGYPELHAEALAANTSMLESIRMFAESGKIVYAECGGLMYLSTGLTDRAGNRFPMSGILPVETSMNDRLRRLGYSDVTLNEVCCWGEAGTQIRGHEFHYSNIVDDSPLEELWGRCYSVKSRRGDKREGYRYGNVLVSYVHLHWASQPELAKSFVKNVRTSSCRTTR